MMAKMQLGHAVLIIDQDMPKTTSERQLTDGYPASSLSSTQSPQILPPGSDTGYELENLG